MDEKLLCSKAELGMVVGRDVKSIVESSPNLLLVGDKVVVSAVVVPTAPLSQLEQYTGIIQVTPGSLHVYATELVRYKYVQMSVQSNANTWLKLFSKYMNAPIEHRVEKVGPAHIPGVSVSLLLDSRVVAVATTKTSKEAKLSLSKAVYLILRWLASFELIESVNINNVAVEPPSTVLELPMLERELPEGAAEMWAVVGNGEHVAAFKARAGIKE